MKTLRYIFVAIYVLVMAGCADFLDKGPITSLVGSTYLSSENQVYSYVNGLYQALPSLTQYGSGVRAVEKNSDNIISEKYDPRINGELTPFDGYRDWSAS